MAEQKDSCLKKVMIGCGCAVGGFVLLGMGFALLVYTNKPEPPLFETQNVQQSIQELEPQAGMPLLPENTDNKPVRLVIDVQMCKLKIVPNAPNGVFNVESEIDTNNFDLQTNMDDKGDHFEYRLTLKDKRKWRLGYDNNDVVNEVTLQIPRNILLGVDLDLAMIEANLDFSGTAIIDFNADLSMGNIDIVMSEPNQVKAESMDIRMSMGEMQIENSQNFRFARGEFDISMGEAHIFNSGPFLEDTEIKLEMSMGEMIFQVPEENRLQSDLNVSMGGKSTPQEGGPETGALVQIKGSGSMGDLRIIRGSKD